MWKRAKHCCNWDVLLRSWRWPLRASHSCLQKEWQLFNTRTSSLFLCFGKYGLRHIFLHVRKTPLIPHWDINDPPPWQEQDQRLQRREVWNSRGFAYQNQVPATFNCYCNTCLEPPLISLFFLLLGGVVSKLMGPGHGRMQGHTPSLEQGIQSHWAHRFLLFSWDLAAAWDCIQTWRNILGPSA